ncbi:hypothetical protein Lesp02_70840 [Lentzea sp. NBRC 105346]|uniref:phage tail tube protein n=1 Tax=Lentzea sp. NBRC 105346 TaxID=3032205 RepID=UPI00249FB319|nr:hypothetical protein [Lentzea sp. NBRC 105346]GLZ34897.1 hypothetical protein Lesp02_70840 [Lentzea sp. NBRC 105346]
MTAIKKRIARFNRLEVDTGPEGAPNFVIVKGLSKIEMPLSETEVDVSDFDSEGWDASLTTHRGWSINVEGFDGFTGPNEAQVDDPGQLQLKTKGQQTGPDAYVNVRFYRTDNNKGFTGRVTVNWGGAGGGVKDAEPFKATLKGDGVLSAYTAP